jgi:hypothetical protein
VEEFQKDPNMDGLRELAKKAHGMLILPQMMRGAFIIACNAPDSDSPTVSIDASAQAAPRRTYVLISRDFIGLLLLDARPPIRVGSARLAVDRVVAVSKPALNRGGRSR